jgi:hypothetical protein
MFQQDGSAFLLSLTPHQPNQNRETTIWRRPNSAPKIEKKQTVMIPRKLKKRTTRMASTKLRKKIDYPSTPIAKEVTTMLAASHWRR